MVDSAVDEMMQAGIIERSNSPWGFPIVLIEKKMVVKDIAMTLEHFIRLQRNTLVHLQLLVICWHRSGQQNTFLNWI